MSGPRAHCRRGHFFTEPITYTDRKGNQHCRRCRSERERLKRAGKKVEGKITAEMRAEKFAQAFTDQDAARMGYLAGWNDGCTHRTTTRRKTK